jgi:hypothetical protein
MLNLVKFKNQYKSYKYEEKGLDEARREAYGVDDVQMNQLNDDLAEMRRDSGVPFLAGQGSRAEMQPVASSKHKGGAGTTRFARADS